MNYPMNKKSKIPACNFPAEYDDGVLRKKFRFIRNLTAHGLHAYKWKNLLTRLGGFYMSGSQKKNLNFATFFYFFCIVCAVALAACDTLPREVVVLSNTVGQDLEAVHRAHRELAQLHFARIERDVNLFIDETYRPEYIKVFAKKFKLASKIQEIIKSDPDSLLPVMTQFVQVATERIEEKRKEILTPIAEQELLVIAEIDAAHRRIQAAHAVVSGHLASVRNVREVQDEIFKEVGFANVREKVILTTASISNRIAEFVEKGRQINTTLQDASEKVTEIDANIEALKAELRQ